MSLRCILLFSVLTILSLVSCHKDNGDPLPEKEVWIIENVAGSDEGYVDGDLASAKFNLPINIVMTAEGDLLVTDQGNFAIRKISNGMVSTVAGTGSDGNVDGPVAQASLDEPYGITTTPDGTIYYVDRGLRKIRKISDGQVTTVAGGPAMQNGTGTDAGFDAPTEIVFAKDNNLYIVDQYSNSIRKMTLEGVVTTYAGALPSSPISSVNDKDGPALDARFFQPTGMCQGPDGSFYFSDQQNGKIKRIAGGNVTTLASYLSFPSGVAVAPDGSVYFLQASSLCKIMADGTVTYPGITGGDEAKLRYPVGIMFTKDGTMYICDTNNHRIAKATRKQ